MSMVLCILVQLGTRIASMGIRIESWWNVPLDSNYLLQQAFYLLKFISYFYDFLNGLLGAILRGNVGLHMYHFWN